MIWRIQIMKCDIINTELDIAKKIIKMINILCIILNIAFIIGGIVFMFYAYSYKYPQISSISKYLIILLLCVSPAILGIIKLLTLKKMKRYVVRIVSNILMQCIFLFLGIVSAICIFIIMPPLESKTDNLQNYLVVDKEVEVFSSVYASVFPTVIPEQATNSKYLYLRKQSFLSEETTITASWTLPQEYYNDTKSNILDSHYVDIVDNNNWEITVQNVRYPQKADLNFIFDDSSQMVTYVFKVNKTF